MSNVIDERVVSMQFDNKNFERNVSQTMSTLDKLKQKLNLPGTYKALDDLNAASKKINFDSMASSIDTIQAKFSALDVVGVTALVNIANQALRTGKHIISALSIDPIMQGYREYETQMGAIQTILANTQSKGTTLDDVTAALDELNTYADKTIYNFTEMTRNIGTFTAAGVDLDKSVTSIKGIANLAAISGSTSQQASVAMYQLSQALAAGRVSLMDWNSVVNAGMGGEVFQNALKRTAEHMGHNVDAAIEKYGSFRESLTRGEWLTSEVLTETLTQLSGAYTEADLIAQGYTESQAKEIMELANTAISAATEVKTFTQLFETLKEAAGSGWAKTWQILIGDFESAKTLLTGLSDTLSGFINRMSDSRNSLLQAAIGGTGESIDGLIVKLGAVGISSDTFTEKLKSVAQASGMTNEEFDEIVAKAGSLNAAFRDGSLSSNLITSALKEIGINGTSSYDILMKKINDAGVSTEDFEAKIKDLAIASGMTGEEFDKIVDDAGSLAAAFRKGKLPVDLVTKAIDSFGLKLDAITAPVSAATQGLEEFQNIVNKTIRGDFGNGAKRIDELTAAGYNHVVVQDLVNKVWERNGKTWADTTITSEDLTEAINGLSEEELKSIGYTQEQAESLKQLAAEAEASGMSIDELIASLDQRTGRELIIDSIANILQPFQVILRAVGEAWKDAFPPMTSETLYNILKAFNSFTEHLVIGDEVANNLTRTLKGLFAILDLVTMVLGGGFKIAFKVASAVVETLWETLGFGAANILEITAIVGDAIVAFRDWVEQLDLIGNVVGFVVPLIINLGAAFVDLVKQLWQLPVVQGAVSKFMNSLESIANIVDRYFGPVIDKIREFINTVSQMKGLNPKQVLAGLSDIFNSFKESLSNIDFKTLGVNIVQGLINGIQSGARAVWNAITELASGLIAKAKELLGIHSPSMVFFDIGNNIIQGLVNGIQNGLRFLAQAATGLVDAIKNVFGDTDFKDLALIGGVAALLYILNKLTKVLGMFGHAFDGFGRLLDGAHDVLESWSDLIDAKAFAIKAKAIESIAKAIGIMAGALVALTLVDQKKLGGALGSLAILSGILAGLAFATSKIGDIKDFGKLSIVMISLSAALIIMAAVMKILSGIDAKQSRKALGEMTAMIVLLGGVMVAFGKISKGGNMTGIDEAGRMFRKMATSLLLMSVALKLIGTMGDGELIRAGLTITGMTALMAGLMYMFKIIDGKAGFADKAGTMFTKFAVAIGILTIAIKAISLLSDKEIKRGMGVIIACEVLFGALIMVSEYAGENSDKAGSMFLKMAVAVGVLSLAIKLLGNLTETEIQNGIKVLRECGVLFGAVVAVSLLAGENANKAGALILKMAGAVAILALTVKLISGISTGDVIKGIGVIAAFEGLFVAIVLLSKFAGQNADKAGSMLLKMSVAMGALVIVVRLIRGLSYGDIAKGLVFLAGCTVLFATLITISAFSGANADRAGTMLMKMAIPIAALAASIAVLGLLDPTRVAVATACMTVLMGMFTVLTQVGKSADGSISTIIALTVAVGLLGGLLILMSEMKVRNSEENAKAISTLLLAMSASMLIISKTGPLATAAIPALLAVSGAVAIIAVILGALTALNVEPSIETAMSLSIMLIAMAAVTAALSAIGPLASGAIAAAGAFDAVVLIIGALMVGLGALVTYIPQVQQFLDTGIGVLNSIATGIGEFAGNLISGFASGVMNILPDLGTKLSEFMINATPFFAGAMLINADSMAGIKALAEAILYLTGANVLDAIAGWLTGESSLEEFGEQLVPFAEDMIDYADAVSGLDADVVVNSANAAQALAALANNLPNAGGLNAFFNGSNNIDDWGEMLPSFGESLTDYSEAVAGVNPEVVEKSATAAMALAELAGALPNIGGVVGFFEGDPDLEAFGTGLVDLGDGIKSYYEAVKGITDYDKITAAVEPIKAVASINDSLEKVGGVVGWFEGEKDLSGFGDGLGDLGAGVKSFYDEVVGIEKPETVQNAVAALKIFAEIGYDGATGIANAMTSLMTLDWEGDMSNLGSGINTFSNSVVDVDITKIRTAITAVKELVAMIQSMDGIEGSVADGFITAFEKVSGVSTAEFLTNFGGSSDELKAAGQNIITFINSGVVAYKPVLIKTINDLLSELATNINSNNETFKTSGNDLINNFNTGFQTNLDVAKNAANAMISDIVDSIRSFYQSFSNAGSYLVRGFANGISSNTYLATAKARTMASAADEAARMILGVHSPSTVGYEIGDYFGIGFVNGIDDNVKTAYKTSANMAEYARDGLTKALQKVSTILASDMDAEPTIRPVMDLSDISDGVASMNNMLSMSSSVGVLSNLGSISRSIRNNQNGVNSDVVSAIKDLKRSLDDAPRGDSYNVNGVTYDDGSNVSDAVQALIRAARIERRK